MTGDAGRIRQILANLVSNAIKFTEAGHVIVRLRAVDQPNGNQLLTLQVVDTGIGIGAQEQSQLFLPFYQIDSASHTVRGTGLGLSICARLAKLMNTGYASPASWAWVAAFPWRSRSSPRRVPLRPRPTWPARACTCAARTAN